MTVPRILVIAGSDSGGGAGIQADIKTITMLGGHAMTAVAAITAQNTLGVQAVMPVPAEMVVKQMEAVLADIGADAVKIGMIGSAETAHAVAERLERLPIPVVFDPVMVATSGSVLADEATVAAFDRLMKLAAVTTPNAPELEALTGVEIRGPDDLEQAARALCRRTGKPVLAKGGHVGADRMTDRLVSPGGEEVVRWESPRIETRHTHGTGCTLASAIASGLASGWTLQESIERARLFVRLALRDAPGLGQGHGPMGQASVRMDLPLDRRPMLNQLTLPASDYEASAAFYRLLGGRQIVASPPRYGRFELPGGMTLSIEVKDPPDPPSTTEHFFQCADVDTEVERLIAAGIAFDTLPEDRPYLWRVAETRDPHGNRIRLYSTGEIRRYPPWRTG